MKKLFVVITSILLLFIAGCETAPEATILQITEEYQLLQDDYDLLKEKVNQLEILVDDNQIAQNESLEAEKIALETEMTILTDAISSINEEIVLVTSTLASMNTTLDTIDGITLSIEQIESSLVSINEVIVLLSNSTLSDDFDQLKIDLEKVVSDIEFKLISLKSNDMLGYTLSDETVYEYMYNINNLYTAMLPSDSINPVMSVPSLNCDLLTYDTCLSNDSNPNIYTNTYVYFLDKVNDIKDKQKYILAFDGFINSFEDLIIPVFLNEEDVYDDGKVKHVERDSNSAIYEFTFNALIDNEELIVDVQFHMLMNPEEPVKLPSSVQNAEGPPPFEKIVNLSFDIKDATTFETIDTILFSYIEMMDYEMFEIKQTDYPTNSMYTFYKNGDITIVEHTLYTELLSYERIQGAYIDGLAYISYGKEDFQIPEIAYKTIDTYSNFKGNNTITDNININKDSNPKMPADSSSNTNTTIIREAYADNTLFSTTSSIFTEVPLYWFDNWSNVYFKEAVDLEPSDISKIIYTDLSEIDIDDTTNVYGSKITSPSYLYYTGTDMLPLENYLTAYLYKGTASDLALSYSVEYKAQLILHENYNLSGVIHYKDPSLSMTFDLTSFTYGETEKPAVVKTQQDVFNDAQRINDVFQLIYSDTYLMNLYYSNMDKYLIGFDETYYDLNSSIVYIDKGTAYITLRASNMGDYQCDYVNMEIATIDDITLKVK